ncbi:hypothetical protein DFH08DRAFT_955836 [Mycena albidolilacea]|uniref:Uncharacterized protein n=1 Tax=Mycena albidolilacea TaxID=1033008 RepID=A0AAD7ACC4_9AGAR|nr:hypothetical protein DFH08DRAFT_955836 [Mycena albidolilacea]
MYVPLSSSPLWRCALHPPCPRVCTCQPRNPGWSSLDGSARRPAASCFLPPSLASTSSEPALHRPQYHRSTREREIQMLEPAGTEVTYLRRVPRPRPVALSTPSLASLLLLAAPSSLAPQHGGSRESGAPLTSAPPIPRAVGAQLVNPKEESRYAQLIYLPVPAVTMAYM